MYMELNSKQDITFNRHMSMLIFVTIAYNVYALITGAL